MTLPPTIARRAAVPDVAPPLPQERDWVSLPGGELEAPRCRTLCRGCREQLRRGCRERLSRDAVAATPEAEAGRLKPLCFDCYRAELDRERKLTAAANLDTASEARFQCTLPFEPVNRARLHQLRAARNAARAADRQGTGRYVDRRRQAQMSARHALAQLAQGLKARGVQMPGFQARVSVEQGSGMSLPHAWLPFVAAR